MSLNNKEFFAYSASAGSGKTYALALRYVALLFRGVNPSSILAATFTKKAANEMRQRVLGVLRDLDDTFLENLQREYAIPKEEALSKKDGVLKSFLNSPTHIVTLDSFFTSILRSSALYINLEPDFKINQNAHEDLNKNFIKNLEQNGEINSLVKLSLNLNKRKSEDLVNLYNNLFTIDALLPQFNYKLHNLNAIEDKITALRLKILKSLEALGVSNRAKNNFLIEDVREFIKRDIFKNEYLSDSRDYAKYIKKEPSVDDDYLELKKEIALFHNALEENILYYLFNLYEEYKKARLEEVRAKEELDFNDILYFTYRLLSSQITKEFLYFKLDSKFSHILLDEFQDTSALQYLILKPLIDEIFSGVGQREFRSFFYVGDVKQSLYRFRGGVEELFEFIAKEYNIRVENLEKNYRSAKILVDSVNRWFINKIPTFTPAIANSNIDGYLKVTTTNEPLEKTKEMIDNLLERGVDLDSTAILVFANKDGVALQEYLKEHNINSILKTSSSLKSNPKVAALIGVLEYLLTKEQIYIEPFLQKCNLELKDFNIEYSYTTKPFDLLHSIIKEYGYFENDLNILKLLEFASNFNTISRFLYEFKRSSIELASKSKDGALIMTIHGSKGLEFKYVIVMDRLGKRPNNTNMLLFKNSSPVKIERIFYKYSKKDNFLLNYKEALKEERDQQLKDRLNLLYVALTRAELGMAIVKKDKNSEFDLINLEDTTKGSIVETSKKSNQEYLELSCNSISSYGKQEVVEKESSEDYEEYNFNSITFGEALHYGLELLDLEDKESINLAIEAVENSYGLLLDTIEIASIKKRLQNLYSKEFLSLISGAKIYKEQPLVYKKSFYKLDLLAKFKDKVVVVDYKSSKKSKNRHINQVKRYKEALREIYKKEIKGYIVYLLDNKVDILEV